MHCEKIAIINFLEETLLCLKKIGKSRDEVDFIISESTGQIGNWDDFESMADFNYDPLWGGEILDDLKIVFRDGSWLERSEADEIFYYAQDWTHVLLPVRSDKGYAQFRSLKKGNDGFAGSSGEPRLFGGVSQV